MRLTVLHSGIFGVTRDECCPIVGCDVDKSIISASPKYVLFLPATLRARTRCRNIQLK